MLYTRKINPIFSDIQNRIFDFEVAALYMMNFEWSYIFPRSRINLPFVVSFIFLGDIVETKLIREATLKNHISGSLRGVTILRYGFSEGECNCSSDGTQFIHQCDQNFNDSQMYISAVNFPLVFMFSVRRQMSPVSARRVAFVFRDFPIGFI